MNARGGPVAFHGGRILSMDAETGEPDVVLIRGGRIAEVGDRSLLDVWPDAEKVDLGGRTLLPGFVDAHNHISIAALLPRWVNLADATDPSAAVERLRRHASANPEQPWVRAAGWNVLETGLHLDAEVLDEAGIDRPILVADFSMHRGVTCSRGLRLLAIGRETPDPPGGEIGRMPDGRPNGVLVERAWSEAFSLAVEGALEPDSLGDAIVARARRLLTDGITCVHDAACAPEAESVMADLARRGRLPVSVVAMPHRREILGRLDTARLDGPVTGEGGEAWRIGAIKLFADGGVAPAVRGVCAGNDVDFGMLMPGLAEDMRAATTAGFDVAVHAIGNAGFEATLSAWETSGAPRTGRRLRIEHACLLTPAQARRAGDLGAVAVVQPGFVRHLGGLMQGLVLDGMEWLPFRTLKEAGVPVAASSDDPCALHEPVVTSALGEQRTTSTGSRISQTEALPYEEWLHAYTHGAAVAGGQEAERGRIVPGMRADLVVLEGPLDSEHPPAVSETWVAGESVYRAADDA